MLFLLIDFPAFKPIAIEIGPFAIRWYALAYISGIVFGWLYARSLLKKDGCGAAPRRCRLCRSTISSSG